MPGGVPGGVPGGLPGGAPLGVPGGGLPVSGYSQTAAKAAKYGMMYKLHYHFALDLTLCYALIFVLVKSLR